ncbi:MAG: hypothetical protein FJX76_06400 [Armatimonadetes bacterium]|nr:hypothetical protein [Armatimonadota bacterium]
MRIRRNRPQNGPVQRPVRQNRVGQNRVGQNAGQGNSQRASQSHGASEAARANRATDQSLVRPEEHRDSGVKHVDGGGDSLKSGMSGWLKPSGDEQPTTHRPDTAPSGAPDDDDAQASGQPPEEATSEASTVERSQAGHSRPPTTVGEESGDATSGDTADGKRTAASEHSPESFYESLASWARGGWRENGPASLGVAPTGGASSGNPQTADQNPPKSLSSQEIAERLLALPPPGARPPWARLARALATR